MAAIVDTSQLKAHVFMVQAAGKVAQKGVEAATKLAAQRVRDTAKLPFAGTRYWKGYPATLGFDVESKGRSVEAEIGPRMGNKTQGSFGHWLEYGTSREGPIKPHLGPALAANEEPYMRALGAVLYYATAGIDL